MQKTCGINLKARHCVDFNALVPVYWGLPAFEIVF